MKKTEIKAFFGRLREIEPEPKGELNWTNPYTLLVAVALSAQATDVSVNKATKRLFPIADTPEKMLALGQDRLKPYIKTIGLFNSKAKNIITMAEQLITEHNSQVPQNRDDLIKLAGVGRKTANVVLNMAFNQPTIAVDTHLFRVGNRTGLARGKTPLAVEKALEEAIIGTIPEDQILHTHHWLILHGRYICKARKPECWRCPVTRQCSFTDKTATVAHN